MRVDGKNLLVEIDGALLLAGFLGLNRRMEALLEAARVGEADAAQRSRAPGSLLRPTHALEVEEQLAADGIDHGAAMAEGETRSRAHHTRLQQRIAHAGNRFHGQDGIANRRGGHFIFAQRSKRAQLAQILEAIDFFLGDEPGSFPGLQLAGADFKDAQDVLTAITGHAWMLPQVKPNDRGMRTQLSAAAAELKFPPRTMPQLSEQLRRNRSHCDYAKSARE